MPKIALDGNIVVRTFTPPPSGFDPLTASQFDLLKHGFPARPDHIPHFKLYEKVFGQMRGRFRYVEPTFKVNANRPTDTSKRLPPKRADVKPLTGVETKAIWSGSIVRPPTGQSVRWVTGGWTIPNVSSPSDGLTYYAALWIGIGGASDEDLLCQVGVILDVTTTGSKVTRDCTAWFMWAPNFYGIQAVNLPVTVGDSVAATICTAGAGATEATIFIANLTSGHVTSFLTSAPEGTLSGDCAEWVVERPVAGGQIDLLANYVNVFFSDCLAVSYLPDGTIGADLGGGSQNSLDMVLLAGPDPAQVISHGILVSDTVVQCEFISSGEGGGY